MRAAIRPRPAFATRACVRSAAFFRRSAAFFSRNDRIVSWPVSTACSAAFFSRRAAVAACRVSVTRARSAEFFRRSRPTCLRSDTMLGRLRHGIPAAPTNFLSRRTSACKDNASFAVRRIASVSARASVSLSRLASHWTFQQPARLRAAISARRHCSACASATSARASASSARARSRSYTKHQSRHSLAGTDSGSDRIPSPPLISVSSVPTSASQVAMRATIAQSRFRYQSPGNRTVTPIVYDNRLQKSTTYFIDFLFYV